MRNADVMWPQWYLALTSIGSLCLFHLVLNRKRRVPFDVMLLPTYSSCSVHTTCVSPELSRCTSNLCAELPLQDPCPGLFLKSSAMYKKICTSAFCDAVAKTTISKHIFCDVVTLWRITTGAKN